MLNHFSKPVALWLASALLSHTLIGITLAAPLHDAARAGKPTKIRSLLAQGADVNAVNYFGFTPLLLAKLNNHPQSASLLQSHGAVSKENELIATLQTYLAFLGFAPGKADGYLGSSTAAALRAFQQQQQLPATGKLSEDTVIQLHRQTLAKVQTRLQQQALYAGKIDGLMGPATATALQAAEQRFGLAASGQLSSALLERLQNKSTATTPDIQPVPQAETDTELIRIVQARLMALGYDLATVDGNLGPRSKQAIRAFQKLSGLKVTGQVSPALADRLRDALNNRATARASRQQRQQPSPPTQQVLAIRQTPAGNTRIQGALRFQRAADGTLLGCSIKGVQLDQSWCKPFAERSNTDNCKVTLRADSSVLLVKCS